MIPYFDQPALQIGPFTIHAFGVLVAAAAWVSLTIVQRRFARVGLDPLLGHRLGGWMLLGGIVGAHLFAVLLYFPLKLRSDPWLLLRVWEDISSFGGVLGGLAAALLFFATRARDVDRPSKVAYLDAIAFVFPAGLAIGRLGCALAHDHPGTVTSFPLAISLRTDAAFNYIAGVYRDGGIALPEAARTMGFHDLGLYEFVFLSFVIVPLFVWWDRSRRPVGFYLMAFAALYLPVRFGLDMLRIADARYLALTPAQWAAAFIMAAVPFFALRERKLRFAICGAVILGTGWACASGGP